MTYIPKSNQYTQMQYRRCGRSGIQLPALSLGLWHNFGAVDSEENYRKLLHFAFDTGITHFDLANNYGPPPGSAETNFGKILRDDFYMYRDELIISTKAGYTMWDGPYGDWGSKKYLISSLNQSLKRMKIDYVDIFYHHRPDPQTPLEETMEALALIVKQGKALYVGISNYPAVTAIKAFDILKQAKVPCLIHQPKYSMFDRWVEAELLNLLDDYGVGCIPFSPLAQGLLTNRYLDGIPSDSRAGKKGFLKPEDITPEKLNKIVALNSIAALRGQSLAQMSLGWLLKDKRISSVLIGASKCEQIADSIACLNNLSFSEEELRAIDQILN